MKSCPQCGRTYPDSESFCDVDGTGLVAGAAKRGTGEIPAAIPPASGKSAAPGVACPACGGRAQSGDEICRFCGASLPVAAGSRSRPANLSKSSQLPPAGGPTPQNLQTFQPTPPPQPPTFPNYEPSAT